MHQAAKNLHITINYKKLRIWLSQKYETKEIYLFLGLIPRNANLYSELQMYGFILIFKETVSIGDTVKGNCDAELVLKSVSDFYVDTYIQAIFITNDGDFSCLVDFLQSHSVNITVLSPDIKYCSFLLRKKAKNIVSLNEVYHKFSL